MWLHWELGVCCWRLVRERELCSGALGIVGSSVSRNKAKLPHWAAPLRVLQSPALVAPQEGHKSQGSGILQPYRTSRCCSILP